MVDELTRDILDFLSDVSQNHQYSIPVDIQRKSGDLWIQLMHKTFGIDEKEK